MLILASRSPRRIEILTMLGYRFECLSADADESLPQGISPQDAVLLFAERKATACAARFSNDTVLGADTLVALDGQILGKPRDETDASRMLRLLSGRTHEVYTGVCMVSPGVTECFSSKTFVTFYSLGAETIDRYIRSGEPFDKAGAYGIQGKGSTLIEKIDGDFFTVMGLPAAKTANLLQKFGVYPDW